MNSQETLNIDFIEFTLEESINRDPVKKNSQKI
jgi:hypothetical protein